MYFKSIILIAMRRTGKGRNRVNYKTIVMVSYDRDGEVVGMGVYMGVEPADLPVDWEDVVRGVRMKLYIDKL